MSDVNDVVIRVTGNMIARTEGPLHFRIFIQPTMAMILALIDGLKDAREGNPPYSWSLVSQRGRRVDIIKNGWKSVG